MRLIVRSEPVHKVSKPQKGDGDGLDLGLLEACLLLRRVSRQRWELSAALGSVVCRVPKWPFCFNHFIEVIFVKFSWLWFFLGLFGRFCIYLYLYFVRCYIIICSFSKKKIVLQSHSHDQNISIHSRPAKNHEFHREFCPQVEGHFPVSISGFPTISARWCFR